MDRRRFCRLAAGSGLALLGSRAGTAPAFRTVPKRLFFEDFDRVVMIGDSITEQHLHSNYVESFLLTRFPRWKLDFRNAGIGGDTSRGGSARIARDVLPFHPTAATITFGMNDGGYRSPFDPARLAAYRAGLEGILAQLREAGVRAAVLSSSPVEKQENGPAVEGYNRTLEAFAAAAEEVAAAGDAVFVDQFHPHLEALQRARDTDPALRINGGDPVHPGPPGQLLMAWAILRGLGAPSLVSSAHVDAGTAHVVESAQCSVLRVRASAGGVSFLRSDEALPWWLPEEARPILKWAPIAEELNRYSLRVTGLDAGRYELRIDGQPCGAFSAGELAAGASVALQAEGPIAAQARLVHERVFEKNRHYHDEIFRGIVLNPRVPEAERAQRLEDRLREVPAYEGRIARARVLQPHRWELVRQ